MPRLRPDGEAGTIGDRVDAHPKVWRPRDAPEILWTGVERVALAAGGRVASESLEMALGIDCFARAGNGRAFRGRS